MKKIHDNHSSLHANICFIIDGTFHPTVRRIHQHLYYRKDKARHFVQTFLLIDFTGLIISFVTGVHGHLSDNVGVRNCVIFNKICEETNSFVISDSGFKNVNFICPGYKISEVDTENRKIWDQITRAEQKHIEHINAWLKIWLSLNAKFNHRGDITSNCFYLLWDVLQFLCWYV